MKALTLIQPWAWCITHSDKRVENRTWEPPASLLGERFAIHAGKASVDEAIVCRLACEDIEVPEELPRGAIVGTARLIGIARDLGALTVAPGVDSHVVTAHAFDRWWIGPIGWVLGGVFRLREPVPCRGAQGLWTVPAEVLARIEEQMR